MRAAGVSTHFDASQLPGCLQSSSADRQQSGGGSVGTVQAAARLRADTRGAPNASAPPGGKACGMAGRDAAALAGASVQSEKDRAMAVRAKQKLSLRKIIGKGKR